MSYQIDFKPTEESLKDYSSVKQVPKFTVDEARLDLLLYCLRDHSNDTEISVVRDISFRVRYLQSLHRDNAKWGIYKEFKDEGVVTFYGWEYSREAETSYEEVQDYVIEKLCVATKAAPYISPYDSENSEAYNAKYTDISNIIDYLDEETYAVVNHEFVDNFQDFVDKPEESSEEEKAEEK